MKKLSSRSESIKVYMFLPHTRALGPYLRFALWVQGCPFHCPGCMTPDARPREGGESLTLDYLYRLLTSYKDIEGITVSGGEPFLQAKALALLLSRVKGERDLGVIIYTGYYLEELRQRTSFMPGVEKLLEMTDLLIDGPYIEALNDGLSLRGSSNQRVHLLNDRYAAVAKNCYGKKGRQVEIHLQKNGEVMAGIPGTETLHRWKNHYLAPG